MSNTKNTQDPQDSRKSQNSDKGNGVAEKRPSPMEVLREARTQLTELTGMAAETVSVGIVPDELKQEHRSQGLNHPRKKKPKELAVITECCTGCAVCRTR